MSRTPKTPPAAAAALNPELEAMLAGALRKPGKAEPAAPEAELVEPTGPKRCGYVAIVGKPNVGKSTLLNALVGQKVSITSRKAQTTRHRITGLRTVGATQFVFVDTPGFQTRHGNALNRSLNKTVLGAVTDVDVIVFVVEAGNFHPADAKVLELLPKNIPVILLANKLDMVHRRGEIAPWLAQMQQRHPFAEFVPMSAKNAKDVQRFYGICEKYLPEQDWMFDADELTDRSERFMAAEMVREKLFRLTGDELPYTSTVIILGDARNNYHASQSWVVKEMRHKARHVYWLNPEPRAYWNTGDSIVGEYGTFCDGTFECRNLRQLERFIDLLA